MSKTREITGTITQTDGTVSQFTIGRDGVWQQWGATRERLGETVDALDAMVAGLFDECLLASSDDEDDEALPVDSTDSEYDR